MYDQSIKEYRCNICQQTITVNEHCWTNIQLPPGRFMNGYIDIRETLKNTNAQIICQSCAQLINKSIDLDQIRTQASDTKS